LYCSSCSSCGASAPARIWLATTATSGPAEPHPLNKPASCLPAVPAHAGNHTEQDESWVLLQLHLHHVVQARHGWCLLLLLHRWAGITAKQAADSTNRLLRVVSVSVLQHLPAHSAMPSSLHSGS
jgi:hypothetical protein